MSFGIAECQCPTCKHIECKCKHQFLMNTEMKQLKFFVKKYNSLTMLKSDKEITIEVYVH